MTGEISIEEAARLLSDALRREGLPSEMQKAGNRLVERLSGPIRITLLGPATTGKRQVVNALAGRSVVPQNQRLPTFEVRYGEARKLRVTLRNGMSKELQGHDFEALPDYRPSFVEVVTDDAYFQNVTLLAVITDGSAEQQLAAASWAANRTDIAIWVTHEFSARQQALWSRMPENLHDHCFLVPINGSGVLNHAKEASQTPPSGSHLFQGVHPLATGDAKSPIDPDGMDALRNELKRCVEIGVQEDLDQALLFLNNTPTGGDAGSDEEAASSAEENSSHRATDLNLLSLESFSESMASDGQEGVQEQDRAALELIKTEAKDMLGLLDFGDDGTASTITERCSETAQKMCHLISDNNPLYDAACRTAEYLVLLELESNADSPENAVTALLQMKRTIEVELAA
ncbi:MAG: hypothetical protein QNJ44_15600 [Rhodobacter sp.]|nr:hypothetical protein [Rhodobacter sp.]